MLFIFFFFQAEDFIRFFFFKQKTAYEIMPSLVGSEMCIRDRENSQVRAEQGARPAASACRHDIDPLLCIISCLLNKLQLHLVQLGTIIFRRIGDKLHARFNQLGNIPGDIPVSYTHLRAHETRHDLVCRLLLEKKKTLTHIHISEHFPDIDKL